MIEIKRILSIGAFLIATVLLVIVVAIMLGPNLAWVPDFVPGSPDAADTQGQSSPTTPVSDPTPTATVEINRTIINPEEKGNLNIELNGSGDGYDSARVALSIGKDEVADIQNASGTGAGDFKIINEKKNLVTFEVSGIDSKRDSLILAQIYVKGDSIGSTTIDAEVQKLTDKDGNNIDPTVSGGNVTVEPFSPNLTVNEPSTIHTNQFRIKENITIQEAVLPESGFIILYNQTDDGSVGDEIGSSSYIRMGEHKNISISPNRLIRNDRGVTARLHYDKNDNQAWDGKQTDTKFPKYNQEVVTSTTTVTTQFVTHVDIVLTNITNGLQRYRIEVHTPSDDQTAVSNVTAHAITGSDFGIIRGGSGYQHVEVQGADLGNQVESSGSNVTLFTIQFRDGDQLERHQVATKVHQLRDDNGDSISEENISAEIHCYSPFNKSVAGQPRYGEPTDPDCDGKFEDVDGDGRLTSNDIQALTYVVGNNLTNEQAEALDFSGNGELTFTDIRWLEAEISE